MVIFHLPKDQTANAYDLITSQVKQNLPLNVGLVFDKYVNKYVAGYLNNERWQEGRQSEIKRQIYLLRKERLEVLEDLKQIMEANYRLREVLRPIIEALQNCDVDNAINKLNRVVKKERIQDLQKCLDLLSKIKLSLPTFIFDKDLYEFICNRMEFVLDDLKKQKFTVKEEILKSNWRLSINLGATSVYETSLSFYRNYSIPYIPGSAVKGVANHYAIMLKEEGKFNNEEYIRIFGDQNKKGEVIFFDAFPILGDIDRDFVVLDVMNVHYREYYQDENGKTPPGDWMKPNPVFFLVVERGTKFRFIVSSRDRNLAEKAMELLKEAIKKIGIGAKTSAGYGYFNTE